MDKHVFVVDDTRCLHNGKIVFGKAKHRDAARSSHAVTTLLWGHTQNALEHKILSLEASPISKQFLKLMIGN